MATSSFPTGKPRLLIIGGEANRNFGSKDFHELFDVEIVEKKKTSIPNFKNDDFDAVIILPWKQDGMSTKARKWAAERKIPCIIARSIGTLRYYIAEQVPTIKKYIEEFESKKKSPKSQSKDEPVFTPKEPASAVLWDEDQLWSAYGEPFVNSIKEFEGETTDRRTFIGLLEGETGLKGEPIEILVSILRRQGIISEHEGGIISIGTVSTIDIEKRRRFIEREAKRRPAAFDNGSRSISNEVRDALSSEDAIHRGGMSAISDEELIEKLSVLNGKLFGNCDSLFKSMGGVGFRRSDGRQFSDNWMREFLFRAEKLGASRVQDGGRYSFRFYMPGRAPVAAPVKTDAGVDAGQEIDPIEDTAVTEAPKADGGRQIVLPVSQENMVVQKDAGGHLVSKPFAQAFSETVKKDPEKPKELNGKFADIGKEGVLYLLLEKVYPGGRLPESSAMVAVVRAFRGLFYENQWDLSSARGILRKLDIEHSESNLKKVVLRKLDFTDDEWSYFAMEYLRDQTLFSLLPMIDLTNRVWKICEECQKHFYFNLPRICFECKDDKQRIISEAKGGSNQ